LFTLEKVIKFDACYANLPVNTMIGFRIVSLERSTSSPIGSTMVSIYDENLKLRRGPHYLVIWPEMEPDLCFNSRTNGLVKDKNIENYIDFAERLGKY
jgi:Phosphoinositide 3-kinase C2